MTTGIDLVHDGNTAWLTVDGPDSNNALDSAAVATLADIIEKLRAPIRLCVLSGAGDRAFISGADIKHMRALDSEEGARFAAAGQALTRLMENSPVLVGALVDGFALGGGTELALACDVVVATTRARFGLPEVRLGIFPGWGGTQRLIRATGTAKAFPYLLTGRHFDAETACELGVASHMTADTAQAQEWFRALAEELEKTGPNAVAAAKNAARLGADTSLDNGLYIERALWTKQFATDERLEGMDAFIERRSPVWTSRGERHE